MLTPDIDVLKGAQPGRYVVAWIPLYVEYAPEIEMGEAFTMPWRLAFAHRPSSADISLLAPQNVVNAK